MANSIVSRRAAVFFHIFTRKKESKMSQESPRLFTNKPKKAKGLSSPTTTAGTSLSSASAAASSYKMGSPPPPPPSESFARRFKFLWPLLLAVNFTVGAYLFMRTKKRGTGPDEEVSSNAPSTPISSSSSTTATVSEKSVPLPTISQVVKPQEPIPENQQRDLFKWILEEKRKVNAKDPEDKKRIDDEKAFLKQLIRAKSIPSI